MADAGTKRESINELLARSNVKETLRRVQQQNDDNWMSETPFWLKGESKDNAEQSQSNPENDPKRNETKEKIQKGETAGLEEKDKKPKGKKTPKGSTPEPNVIKQDKSSPKSKDKNHWNDFLSKLEDRRQNPYKGKKTGILMPVGIVNALQTAFGRRSSDILSILALEFFESERENIHAHIKKRSNPNIND